MNSKLLTMFFCLLFFGTLGLGAQDSRNSVDFNRRTLGDRAINFQLGSNLPLFWQPIDGPSQSLNMSMSMLFGIEFGAHLTNEFRLNGAFKGNLHWGPNNDILFSIPLTFTGTYELKFYPFSIPFSLGPGIVILTYQDLLTTNFLIHAGTGFYWTQSRRWSYGVNLNYTWIPQLYNDNPVPKSHSGFANFMEVSFGIRHYFN